MNIKELTKQKEREALEFKASLGEWKEIIETIHPKKRGLLEMI